MDLSNIHAMLKSLHTEMLSFVPGMQGIACAIAGLGALFFISFRVWQSLAKAEPIEVFPLLRPFVIGGCILLFPSLVLGTLDAVLSPVVQGVHSMLESQTFDMYEYLAEKEAREMEEMKNNPETAYLVDDEEFERQLSKLGLTDIGAKVGLYFERAKYDLEQKMQRAFCKILELVFQATSLIIDVIRTFFLIVLAILGPLAFAISVWDGFHNTLVEWFSRYISIYLWLPVSDLFSMILAKLRVLLLDNNFADSSSALYIIFMLIGIIGYFSVPTVASWIVQSGGGGNYGKAINSMGMKAAAAMGGYSGAKGGSGGMGSIAGKLHKPTESEGDIMNRNKN